MSNIKEVTDYIVERCNRETSMGIKPHDEFTEVGLDSLDMMGIFQDVEKKFDINIKFSSSGTMDTPYQLAEIVVNEIIKKEL
jgi:acyl carrier protein